MKLDRCVCAVGLVAIVTAACGGAAKSASEPASPATSAPPGYAPLPAPGGAAGTGTGAAPSREATLSVARGDLESAQRELDVAAGDCMAACRALGAMDRATGHLCGLVQESDERTRCEEAKNRVRGARDKVRTTCGTCPGGVSVDRNAPVPTER